MNDNTKTVMVAGIEFSRDGHQFRILANPAPTPGGRDSFIGYHGEIKSVSANKPDVCARALVRKHVKGLPKGELIRIADLARRRMKDAISAVDTEAKKPPMA